MIMVREMSADDWVAVQRTTDIIPCFDTKGLVAIDEEGVLCGAVVFDQFTLNSAQCHIVLPKPIQALRAGLLENAAEYIFGFYGCGVVFGISPSNNDKATRFNKHFGFREVARLKDAFEIGVDSIIWEVTKSNCSWYTKLLSPKFYDYQLGEVRRCG